MSELSIPPQWRGSLVRAAATVWQRVYLPKPVRHAVKLAYAAGRERLEYTRERRSRPTLTWHPRVRLLVPVRGQSLADVRASVASVRHQSYPEWEVLVVPETPNAVTERGERALDAGDPRVRVWRGASPLEANAALSAAMTAPGADFVAVVEPGDTLAGHALHRVAALLTSAPDTDVVYTDERVSGRFWGERPAVDIYKPDWSPEHALSEPYTGRLCVYRRTLVAEAGGLRDGFDAGREYDLLLRLYERGARVRRVPGVLYRRRAAGAGIAGDEVGRAVADHLRRVGADAVYVEPSEAAPGRVRYRVRGTPRVSIIIPTIGTMTREVGDRTIDLLANTVRSIAERTEYPDYEIIYVNDRPLGDETRAVIAASGAVVRGVPYDRPFNWSEKMNVGADAATGEHLLALNDDVEVINGDWLSAMLEFSQQAAVGAVGAKMYFADGSIQHAGVAIANGSPGHPYYGLPPARQAGVVDLAVVRNYSAVTGACLMTRADVFREVGGFTRSFAVNFNDIDYCLKVRARGYRVVFTPHAELYHYESMSRVRTAVGRVVSAADLAQFAEAWPDVTAGDPYCDARRRLREPR